MGQIRKHGTVYWIRYYRNGKRYEESSGSDNHKEAKALLATREGDIAEGIPVSPQRFTFDEAMKHVLSHYQAKQRKSTDAAERRITKHLTPFFGGRKMAAITTDVVAAYTTERLNARAAHATVNRELALLKLAFSLAVKARRLLYKPHIEMLAESNARTGFLEQGMFESVCRRLPEDVQAVVRFAYITGWRKSEVLALTWDRVNFEDGIVELEKGTTKNGNARKFAFAEHPELAALLDDLKAKRDEQRTKGRIVPSVFHRNGKPIRNYYKAWHTACKAAGCPGRLPHDMRRSSVRDLVRAGVSENTAMLVSGHKTRAIFDRYDIQSDQDLRDASRKLAGTKRGQSTESAAS